MFAISSGRDSFRPQVLLIILLLTSALRLGAQSASTSAQSLRGQQIFTSTCSACHGLDGRGGEHGPNIATESGVKKLSDSALVQIVTRGVPNAGMPGFKSTFSQDQIASVVSYVRNLQGQTQKATVSGNAKRGRAVFFEHDRCSRCHMVDGQGGFLGADLSEYGKTHSPEKVRESILSPERTAEAHHGTVIAWDRTGIKYSGIVRNEDNFSLQMQTEDGSFHFFDKSMLRKVEYPANPLMPSDYGKTLTASQLDDLVSFLMNAGGDAQTVNR